MVACQDLFSMFEAALGLVAPWQVTSVEFDKDAGQQQIGLGFPRGHGSPVRSQGSGHSDGCVFAGTRLTCMNTVAAVRFSTL